MRSRRKLHFAVLSYKIINCKTPPYLHKKISFRGDISSANIRNPKLISPPPHRTCLFERSFSYTVFKIYNSLPTNIKLVSYLTFKQKIKRSTVVLICCTHSLNF
nr:unnamed protein product [Callosobruchus analis]